MNICKTNSFKFAIFTSLILATFQHRRTPISTCTLLGSVAGRLHAPPVAVVWQQGRQPGGGTPDRCPSLAREPLHTTPYKSSHHLAAASPPFPLPLPYRVAMALAARVPHFQPWSASISAPASISSIAAAAANARPRTGVAVRASAASHLHRGHLILALPPGPTPRTASVFAHASVSSLTTTVNARPHAGAAVRAFATSPVVALGGRPQPGGVMHPPNPRGWLLGDTQAIRQIYS